MSPFTTPSTDPSSSPASNQVARSLLCGKDEMDTCSRCRTDFGDRWYREVQRDADRVARLSSMTSGGARAVRNRASAPRVAREPRESATTPCCNTIPRT